VPTEAELERAYGSWYRPPGGRFSGVGDQMLGYLRGRLARRLDDIAPPGPVLDVGAGDGALLDALTARGRAAVGLERRSTRDDIRAVDLTEVRERWAAIVFWHSLEHLREPGATLEHAARLLLPDGVIVVAIPNLGSIQARALVSGGWRSICLVTSFTFPPRLCSRGSRRWGCAWNGSATYGGVRWCSGGFTESSAPCRPDPTSTTRFAGRTPAG
jgi:SAM-dependent methyltransferase